MTYDRDNEAPTIDSLNKLRKFTTLTKPKLFLDTKMPTLID